MALSALDKMIKARAALIMEQRFFGSLALKLRMKEEKCDTLWTDGETLGFDPDFVNSIPMDELKGVICHEVMHVALSHHTRRGNRDHGDWNISGDYAVNPIIRAAGMPLPKSGADDRYKGKSADDIYSILQGKKPKQGNDGGKGQGQPGQDQNQSQGQGDGQSNGDPGKCGEVRDYKGGTATKEEKQLQEQEWKIAVATAAKQAEGCGQMPGGLKEIIKEYLETKVDWTSALQRFVEQVAHNDYTFSRPNVRYAGTSVILPALHNLELPPIDVHVDTSGSISTEDKKQFAGEINDIRSRYRTTIRVIFTDTDVRHVQIIEPDDDFIELECRGGGGTRFSPAIAWSMAQEERPVAAIYLTDMDCGDFGPEPDFPVLWIQTRKGYRSQPPWGELIMMHPMGF